MPGPPTRHRGRRERGSQHIGKADDRRGIGRAGRPTARRRRRRFGDPATDPARHALGGRGGRARPARRLRRGVGRSSGAGPQGSTKAERSPSATPSKHSPSPTPKPRPELPRGGRELSRYRLVGYCGLPGAAALGRLGVGDLEDQVRQIEKTARAYAADREPQPVLELLATVANSSAGPDGAYRSRTSSDTIRRFHDAAKRHRALLLLNIQPGRASVLGEVKALREWLVHPDVGIALDPEWEMGPGEVPGNTYGHTSGKELTDVARYLSGIVDEHDLPQKPLVFHQVAVSVVSDQSALRPQPGVVLIKSADGIGSPGMKRDTWRQLVRNQPEGVRTGFKLFYEEDTEGSS
ncbi:hypothetical protein ACFQ10_04015 [Streptomyces indonesiensis]